MKKSEKTVDANGMNGTNGGAGEIKRGRGRPRKEPGAPREKSKETLEADRLIEETVEREETEWKETGLTKETVMKRMKRAPSVNPGYRNIPSGMIDRGGGSSEGGKLSISDLIQKNLEVAKMPNIDLMDAVQVEQRILEYFAIEAKYNNRPTVTGLGMCLNAMDRRRLWEIVTGNMGNTRGITTELPRAVTVVIKKYYAILTNLWEDYMQSGKINPVSGIFLGKNHFGYKDQTEYVITPNQQPEFNEQDIRERLALPEQDDSSDSDE